jgi:predicted Zn-dependent protease with MMP-like domain
MLFLHTINIAPITDQEFYRFYLIVFTAMLAVITVGVLLLWKLGWPLMRHATRDLKDGYEHDTRPQKTYESLQPFDQAVHDAVLGFPPEIQAMFYGMEIVIEDWSTEDLQQKMGISEGRMITGLYEGYPLPTKHWTSIQIQPDRTRLFRGPIIQRVNTDEDLRSYLQEILLHELGHHLGWSHEQLKAYQL